MDSTRINVGKDYSVPQRNEYKFLGTLMPVTPDKPIPIRSKSTQIDWHESQLDRGNWQELAEFPSVYVRDISNCSSGVQIAGSCTQALRKESAGWNDNRRMNILTTKNKAPNTYPHRGISMVEKPLIPHLHSHGSSIRRSDSGNLPFANLTHYTSSNLMSGHETFFQIPQCGFPIVYDPNYDTNPVPSMEAGAASTVTSSFQLTPTPPQQANKLENQLSATGDFPQEKRLSEERDKRQDLTMSIVNSPKQHNSELFLHYVMDLSSAVIPAPFGEPKDSGNESCQVVDLNTTPQQKPQKRRKHRPKVIVEGKQNKTPKATTAKRAEPKEKATEKRKYVRKSLQESVTPNLDSIGESTDSKEKPKEKRKYVRKSQQESATQNLDSIEESTDSKEKPKEKRKYVRKKSLKEPVTENADSVDETTYPCSRTAAPSCRRALNFDNLENTRNQRESNSVAQQEILNKQNEASNLSIGFQVDESINGMMYRTKSDLLMSQQSEATLENQQSRATSNLTSSMNQLLNDISKSDKRDPIASYISILDKREIAVQLASMKNVQMDNLNANATDKGIGIQQHIHAGVVQIAFPPKFHSKGLESTRQMTYKKTRSVPEISPHLTECRGFKRECSYVQKTSHYTANPPRKFLCQEIPHTDDCHLFHRMSGAVCSETRKKRKIENRIQTNINGMQPSVTAANHSKMTISNNHANSIGPTSERNSDILNSYFERDYVKEREINGSNRLTVDWYTHSMASGQDLLKQHILSGQNSSIERIEETNRVTKIQNLVPLNTIQNYNMPPPIPPKIGPHPGDQLQPKIFNVAVSRAQETGPNQSKSVPSRKGGMLEEQADVLKDFQSPAKSRARSGKQKFPATIEEIIYRMEGLNLNRRGKKMNAKEQNALVPYKGDGTLIPYQGFEFIKKRKPRPKVDLDPETERVWKLLMWKEGSEGLEETDQEKKKWWEEERTVFRGRADSFIARMHLVQGDRRFSKWKGSVVDSVIGVFLTQNVSDHLSSSAFMSLAARFPLKSARKKTCKKDGTIVLIEEPDACILNPNDTINWYEKLFRHPSYNQASMTLHESTQQQRDCEFSWTEGTSIVETHSHSPEEEGLSSQDSFDSSVTQGNVVRSYSGSNSEAEDPATGCKYNNNISTSSTKPLQLESTTLFEEFYNHVSRRSMFHEAPSPEHKQWPRLGRFDDSLKGSSTSNQQINYSTSQMQVPVVPSSNHYLYTTAQSEVQVESSELYGEESISLWPSRVSIFSKEKDASFTSKRVLQGAENVAKIATEQHRSVRHQGNSIMDPHAILSKQVMCEQSRPESYHQNQLHEMNKTFQLESTSIVDPANLADLQANRQHVTNTAKVTGKVFDVEDRNVLVDKQTHVENQFIESNLKEKVHFTNKVKFNMNSLKAREEKAEIEKKDAVDWDNLRKQAQANGKKKERSQDTMDSMDYEAMRCANVNEISTTIKERGMNNMLAERIKEFLDRLVREHGSIDLEWLRDVPPEKAKEYLLSIRGLGLKSVECVRLLTLHHLAFPVDTNVGRIAVRLGWVPLQPLPESLQLHLLELYPVLESIQKYIWPRLCKLDQRTLYELHYQMITFGKVFCTKNRPNCNACPMRAECRHFASAFASARLALPGPEEKSIVTSNFPLTERSPGIVIDPMPLPLPEDNSLKRRGSGIVSCAPIIEEPATPEQEHAEVIKSDIEDTFDEDPDEIPTIKLNMEELQVNVQNYIQANMELQECDMSKALVALNPEAASIPTPKLKNISRLRTEHQVYELPDSHPLLKGMDKREIDDPSPYLLAIWTPGETANSIQPPEQHCQSWEPDKVCNDKTCFSCNSIREANSQIVRGTLLIPCRTAMRGSFPLNGTYFQVNEVFADHESSLNPIDVPRAWIWNLSRRIVYFGTSVSTIFKGLSTEGIQYCFWKGFVCVRGFDQKTRAPRPLVARLHFPASKLVKTKNENND